MFVGIAQLEFHFPFVENLKEKRHIVSKIKGRIKSKFSVFASEVGFLDKWQRSLVGFALVSSEQRLVESQIDKIFSFVEQEGFGELLDSRKEILSYGNSPY